MKSSLVLSVKLSPVKTPVPALCDTSCKAIAFMDLEKARAWGLPIKRLTWLRLVTFADSVSSTVCKYVTEAHIAVGSKYRDHLTFYLTPLAVEHLIILGLLWFSRANPEVDWKHLTAKVPQLSLEDHRCWTSNPIDRSDISLTSVSAVSLLLRWIGMEVTVTSLEHLRLLAHHFSDEEQAQFDNIRENGLRLAKISPEDAEIALKKKPALSQEEVLERLPPEYHNLVDAFLPRNDELPPYSPHDYTIYLKEGARLPQS